MIPCIIFFFFLSTFFFPLPHVFIQWPCWRWSVTIGIGNWIFCTILHIGGDSTAVWISLLPTRMISHRYANQRALLRQQWLCRKRGVPGFQGDIVFVTGSLAESHGCRPSQISCGAYRTRGVIFSQGAVIDSSTLEMLSYNPVTWAGRCCTTRTSRVIWIF